MNEEPVTIQPEIIEFVSYKEQKLKVTNNTFQTISNCFFCLFNTAKYKIQPENFSLEPKQHKIITITLLLKKNSSVNSKQFAYLKSDKINKRITIITNILQSPERLMSPSSGIEELNTLSSRDYRNNQETGFMKIIQEKEKYIEILQRQIQERQSSLKKSNMPQKGKLFYIGEIESLEIKIDLMNREKQELIRQNLLLKQKIEELESLDRKRLKTFGQHETQENFEEIQYLQARCEEYLNTISEKQGKVRQLESENKNIKNQLRKDNEERLRILQRKLQEQKNYYEQSFQGYLSTIKQLEASSSESQQFREKSMGFQKQINTKEDQILRIKEELEKQKIKLSEYENEKNRNIKLGLVNSSLEQKNLDLSSRVRDLQKMNEDLRDQTIVYKSKIENTDSDRMGHLMQVALESCRNQNQILKKNKNELQKSLAEQVYDKNSFQDKNIYLQRQLEKLQNETNYLKQSNKHLVQQKQQLKQESHENMMKLKTQNIDLLEKVNLHPKEVQEQKKSKERIIELQKELSIKHQQCQEREKKERNLTQKIIELQNKYDKVSKKINKYKFQAKKQLKNLNQTTLEELKRVNEEKKKLSEKVLELEESAVNQSYDRTRMKSKSKGDKPSKTPVKYPKSESLKKRVGIKDQRRVLQESRANSSNHQQIDLEGLYGELGELRELRNYLYNEQERFNRIFGIGEGRKEGKESIFNSINFFKELEGKINDFIQGKQKKEKEVKNLKEKVSSLESKNKEKMHQISEIQINKNESERTLLEYVRQEMKNQYKKLYDSVKFNEEKYSILKKKIYEEYRGRIIELLIKKDKPSINKVQSTLERFIEGLSNLSHKEAVLAKEVKLKQNARKQVSTLRQKVQYLQQLLETKKGYCTREPLKIFGCDNESEWHDNIRLQAQLLTYEAENVRLREELQLEKTLIKNAEEELKNSILDMEEKENEIIRLKREIIKVEEESEFERNKNLQQIESLKTKFIGMQKVQSEVQHLLSRQKQYQSMKDDLSRKKQLIKHLKQKEKMLQQLLSSQRNDTNDREKERRQMSEVTRTQEALRDFKENNRQLRVQNKKLQDKIQNLEEELQRKNTTIKRLKGDGDQQRIRTAKNEQIEVDSLRRQIKDLKEDVKKYKEDIQKLKKKKERQVTALEAEIHRVKNQHVIQIKSLESIVRALADTFQRIYNSIELSLRKKSKKTKRNPDFDELRHKPGQVDSLKVYESFEEALTLLKEQD